MPTTHPGPPAGGAPVAIDWACVANGLVGGRFSARLRLRNASAQPIAAKASTDSLAKQRAGFGHIFAYHRDGFGGLVGTQRDAPRFV